MTRGAAQPPRAMSSSSRRKRSRITIEEGPSHDGAAGMQQHGAARQAACLTARAGSGAPSVAAPEYGASTSGDFGASTVAVRREIAQEAAFHSGDGGSPLLQGTGATTAELLRWMEALAGRSEPHHPWHDSVGALSAWRSSDVLSWPKGWRAEELVGTALGERAEGAFTALSQLHAALIEPAVRCCAPAVPLLCPCCAPAVPLLYSGPCLLLLAVLMPVPAVPQVRAGRLPGGGAYSLERLLWARGAQLAERLPTPAGAAEGAMETALTILSDSMMDTEARLWAGLPPRAESSLLDTHEATVACVIAVDSAATAARASRVVALLQDAEGLEVDVSPAPDGSGVLLRSGPFTLRRGKRAAECVPALLWCFACLAVGAEQDEQADEAGEKEALEVEPEVTLDESDQAVGFLRALMERLQPPDRTAGSKLDVLLSVVPVPATAASAAAAYREGQRQVIAETIGAIEAMVKDSAPLRYIYI